jgi:phosphoglycolate phosphatase-like HAD superfamily hydrolase
MLSDYAALVFDCDGVVLDSNRIKTEAFRLAALPYGAVTADALVAHHVANGGISRYAKFQYFLDHIVPAGQVGPDLDALLTAYAEAVRAGLVDCAVTPRLEALRAASPQQRWLIVSGGDQAELRDIFAARGLDRLFDGGIFGSPDNKDTILARELACGNIPTRALFLGDSTYDYRAASGAGLDFVFVNGWSEVPDWPSFVRTQGLKTVAAVHDLK